MTHFNKYLIIMLFFLSLNYFSFSFAHSLKESEKKISLDLQSLSVQDALHMLAKLSGKNIIISPLVTGNISLHLHDITVLKAFEWVLKSRNLIQYQENNIFFVVSREEFVRDKTEELKLQEIVMATVPLTLQVWQIHYARVEDIAHLIQDSNSSLLSKRGYVHSDTRTNQLCVQDTREHLNSINRLIKHVDIPVKQVLIETRLASVDSDFERELGISFSAVAAVQANQDQGFFNSQTSPAHYGLAVAKLADGALLDIKLAALENTGHGELISSPSLFTANQQAASIESGEEIPYQEISRSGATGIAFKKAVLSLKVTPQILPDNRVLLQLQINQDKPSNRIVLGVPAITTRQITTSVLAVNGQTIVLGGIFESNKDNIKQGVPFLDKIPLVGWVFRQHNVIENKRELLVFVTPKIMYTS
ncbi:MAG: Type IV pilus biogenesis protein PilQ [uncultured bacterium]|nr:MAG: Type IV pilus biogenesis protein PilQ [uncultured bacterium]